MPYYVEVNIILYLKQIKYSQSSKLKRVNSLRLKTQYVTKWSPNKTHTLLTQPCVLGVGWVYLLVNFDS